MGAATSSAKSPLIAPSTAITRAGPFDYGTKAKGKVLRILKLFVDPCKTMVDEERGRLCVALACYNTLADWQALFQLPSQFFTPPQIQSISIGHHSCSFLLGVPVPGKGHSTALSLCAVLA